MPEAPVSLTLLRHNENQTYRVECESRVYSLRIRQPVAGFDLSVLGGEPEPLLEGELELLDRIRRETDFAVPVPVPSRTGGKVVRLLDGSLASLLVWLDGIPLAAADRSASMLFEVGRTLASLRTAAETHPDWNVIPRYAYDSALARRLIERANRAKGILPAETVENMAGALGQIAQMMEAQERREGRHLSHADPGFGNLVWTGDKVGLIDWSLSGSAPSCMDLGGLMGATSDRA
jgi:Ser/Thr protein kinase RdoA (MazF antagonist)